jgi:hypothetical protein
MELFKRRQAIEVVFDDDCVEVDHMKDFISSNTILFAFKNRLADRQVRWKLLW